MLYLANYTYIYKCKFFVKDTKTLIRFNTTYYFEIKSDLQQENKRIYKCSYI